jgi:hypothetical protein
VEHLSPGAAQQSVTEFIAMTVMNFVIPKASALGLLNKGRA